VEVAEVAVANGKCATRIVSIPMTNVWAKAARTRRTGAARLVLNVRRVN
jgi:hypothetical protein